MPLPQTGAGDDRWHRRAGGGVRPLYRERYAFFFEGEPIELVNLRLAASGRQRADPPGPVRTASGAIRPRRVSARRPVYFEKRGYLESDVLPARRLRPGMIIRGPAIVEEPTSVTLIPPGIEPPPSPPISGCSSSYEAHHDRRHHHAGDPLRAGADRRRDGPHAGAHRALDHHHRDQGHLLRRHRCQGPNHRAGASHAEPARRLRDHHAGAGQHLPARGSRPGRRDRHQRSVPRLPAHHGPLRHRAGVPRRRARSASSATSRTTPTSAASRRAASPAASAKSTSRVCGCRW